MVDGNTRTYNYHLPPGYSNIKKYPLILNLHGNGSTKDQQEYYSEFNAVADSAGIIMAYPQGLSNTWNSGFSFPYNSGTRDPEFLLRLVDTLSGKYSIDTNKVYICGMSMGGFMSYRMACEYPEKFAAMASVTGLMGDSVKYYCDMDTPIPILQIHGTSDAIVPYSGNFGYASVDTTINFWRIHNQCSAAVNMETLPDLNGPDNSSVIKYTYSGCKNHSDVVLYKVNSGGHTWPGAIAIPANGNTNYDIHASREIWKFFKEHPKQDPVTLKEKTFIPPINIYPNPFNDVLNIQGIFKGWKIYNILGEAMLIGDAGNIQTGSLNPGVYIIIVQHVGGSLVKKLIKQ